MTQLRDFIEPGFPDHCTNKYLFKDYFSQSAAVFTKGSIRWC